MSENDPTRKSGYPPGPAMSEFKTEVMLEKILNKVDKADTNVERLSSEINSLKNDINDVKVNFAKHGADLENIKKSADSREGTLNKIHDAIYDPEKGIYASIKENDSGFVNITGRLDALERHLDDSKTSLKRDIADTETKLKNEIKPLLGDHDALLFIGGDKQLTSIKSAVEAHKNFNKLWWALILAVVSGFGKFAWDIAKDYIQ